MPDPRFEITDTPAAAGALAASFIAERIDLPGDGPVALGCPAGRSPGPTYAALATIAAERCLDLSDLHLVMMDEYVVDRAGSFASADDVPTHGVTVGLGTIARWSRHVVLVLTGAEKGPIAKTVVDAHGSDPTWPATVVWGCHDSTVVMDRESAVAGGVQVRS